MIIKKIKLENIRSYANEEIEFPEGSVLLSGDIGAGKSSILLSIEFALFGLERGSGSALLRNGKDKGSAELFFELDNKEIIIKRTLKRTSKSVSQDSGYIILNGRKEEGTATELKAKILELLKYPKEYLTKGKGLIYKYTVYTPQEEMKQILTGDKEERLHVLRKVFDIDKYKRIQENSNLFLKYIRSECRVYEERLKDLEIKKSERENIEFEIFNHKENLLRIERELNNTRNLVDKNKEESKIFEDKIKKLNELNTKISLLENELNYKLNEKIKLEKRIEKLSTEAEKIEEENFNLLILENNKKLEDVKKNIFNYEEDLDNIKNKLGVFKARQSNALEIKNKIKGLEKCPTCYQDVPADYKESIIKSQEEIINSLNSEISALINSENKNKNNLSTFKGELEKIRSELKNIEIKKIKFETLLKKKEEILEVKEELNKTEKIILKNNSEREILFNELENMNKIIKEYDKLKDELEKLLNNVREIEILKWGTNDKIKSYNETLVKLDAEIKVLIELNFKLEKIRVIENWLENHFLNLMNTIEKNVMLKLHSEFNILFKKWFDVIIDNSNLTVSLDEEFTPIINQEGYEMDYSDLSGGERTAGALAYRLSLNQVINDLVGDIKTRDLLILDEPTDGFSSEQLDRVRVVLDELSIKQVIIVSHEAKIESFVDNVLKFEKKEGASHVNSKR